MGFHKSLKRMPKSLFCSLVGPLANKDLAQGEVTMEEGELTRLMIWERNDFNKKGLREGFIT